MAQWHIGLVGVGRGSGYGRVFAGDPRCEIVACCDASSEALARFQQSLELDDSQCFTDYEEFLNAPTDIVFVGTPMPVHAEETVAAVQAGKHVLSEVTAASTVDGCMRILEAVRRSGQTYMMAENCCYWPFVREWQGLVDDGRLGQVMYCEGEYIHNIRTLIVDPATGAKRWRFERAPLHYCTHSLGPLLQIARDRIVRACGLGEGHRIMPEAPIGGIDIQVALFETEKGAMIKLLRSSVAPRRPNLHFFSVMGSRGYVESARRGVPGTGLLYLEDEMDNAQDIEVAIVDTSLPESARAGGHGTAEYSLVQDFLAALEAGKRAPIDEVRALEFSLPGLIAHESAMKHGAWLNVPDVRS